MLDKGEVNIFFEEPIQNTQNRRANSNNSKTSSPVMNIVGATQVFPNLFEYSGKSRVTKEIQLRLNNEMNRFLQENFGVEIGLDVVRLNLIPHAVQMNTHGTGRSITIVLESMHSCLKNLTESSIGLFHQKGPAVLMRFDLPDGPRHLAVYLSPTICPMRIMIASNGLIALDVSLVPLKAPTTLFANICMIDRYACFQCGRKALRMPRCGKCNQVQTFTRYCGRACRKAHWPIHKKFCGM
jgi:hypothetical protein